MAETFPPPRRSNRARIVSRLYDYTSNVADQHGYDSNRGLAAGTAAAVLGLGLEKIETRNSEGSTELEYSEVEADLIEKVASSAEEMRGDQAHFMEKIMDRIIKTTMPNSPDGENLSARMRDPSRAQKSALSIRKLVLNSKELSSRLGAFFKVQYGIIHIVTWRKPTKTVSVLVAYTSFCLWPHLILSVPLLVLIFCFIIPGYLHRHPMDIPEILPIKKRGSSLLQYFNESDDSSLLTDVIEEKHVFPEDFSVSNESVRSETMSAISSREDTTKLNEEIGNYPDKLDSKDKTKIVKSQISLLMNMQDLQNLTSDLLKSINNGEIFINELTGFKDERMTTFVFYILSVFTGGVLITGKFIPWRSIFILSGWAVLGLCHPGIKKHLVALSNNRLQVDQVSSSSQGDDGKSFLGFSLENFDRQDIIVDEHPEVRLVEIFELQKKDIFKQRWDHFAYTKRLFDFGDSVRVSGSYPRGVDHLTKVFPPIEWRYDSGLSNNWRIDTNPAQFISLRRIDMTHLKVPKKEYEGWIYDVLPIDEDTTQEFRRRRLYRVCYRYARPYRLRKLK